MNITQKYYNKIYLNYVLAPIFFFYILCTYLLLFLIKYSFHVKVCLVCHLQRFFPKMELVKTSLPTQLKQTNLENQLHISAESPKGFNDTVFQHFVDELKHCKQGVWTDIQLVPVFLCLYLIYLVVMLPFKMIFLHNMLSFISFLREFVIF